MTTLPKALGTWLLRGLSRISIRLLTFNLLLVFLPILGILFLATYEDQLLRLQENSMVQQGRLLAASLGGRSFVSSSEAQQVLANMEQRFDARLRVFDTVGAVLADSSQMGPRRLVETTPENEVPENASDADEEEVRQRFTYRLGLFLYRLYVGMAHGHDRDTLDETRAAELAEAARRQAIAHALEGRYGRAVHPSAASRSLTLYSAIPVRGTKSLAGGDDAPVIGAVLVSKSTVQILRSIWDFRISAFEVVLASVATALILSLLASFTIASPILRLRTQAQAILDRRGRLRGRFQGSKRLDEIGDLSRALAELTRRLENHIQFIEGFASDVSHEFKNPLAAIRNATELLAEVDDPAERQRFLAMAQRDIQRLERLLTGVREITRIDAQLEVESSMPVKIDALLRGLVERYEVREGLDLTFDVQANTDESVVVIAAPDRLAQVFENLLANAISFSPPGGAVAVWIEDGAKHVRVRIRDQGPGIPEEHLDRLFDRFFSYRPVADTAEATPSRPNERHTGLGLSIVRAIVEGYGGGITAHNAEGGGAEFEVSLPKRRFEV